MNTSTTHLLDGDEPIRAHTDADSNHVSVRIGDDFTLAWGRVIDPAAKAQQIRDLAAALVTLADALEPERVTA